MSAVKELVEFVVQSMVDHPEQVVVSEVGHGADVTVELSVAEADMGRVIGSRGRVINSIRTVVQVLAVKQGKRVTLELLEHDERR
ncbi:MAG: KH domain-containing protein [Ardenticatenaceae bacterium]|nr:KH domain-containing protein [Ardenticatenaceae bacterium]